MKLFSSCTMALGFFLMSISLSAANSWTLIGWSDLGMNPTERDYSLFAIYPLTAPFTHS